LRDQQKAEGNQVLMFNNNHPTYTKDSRDSGTLQNMQEIPGTKNRKYRGSKLSKTHVPNSPSISNKS